MVKQITLAKGGTAERTVNVGTLRVPDLWHLIMYLEDHPEIDIGHHHLGDKPLAEAVRECWHLCHDLLRAAQIA